MTHAAPFSILPLHPSLARSARPPVTLAQVRQVYAQRATEPLRLDARINVSAIGGERLLDLLARMSADHGTIHFFCPDEIEPVQLNDLIVALEKRRPAIRLSLACRLCRKTASDLSPPNDCNCIAQIQWSVTNELPDLLFFKAFSRAGVWNHLVLDGIAASPANCRIVASQPNIIHSWGTTRAGDRIEDYSQAYGRVSPLPGRPLWQTVNDLVHQFLLVDRLTRDRMLRLRIDEDGEHLYVVGAALEYHFLPPNRLPDGYLDEICAMVAAGGTVATTHVRSNLERAFLIGYVEERGVIAGNSSLKNPRPTYIDSVQRQSGLDLSGYVERGYTSVRPEYRGLGLGTKLLAGLTQRAGDRKIFSVISEDNTATQTIAMRNRTRKVATYFSEKAGKPVGIWMPEWTIAKNDIKH